MNTEEHSNASDINVPMPRLLSGNLCLDFVNTLDPRGGPHPRDLLVSYLALVAWGRHTATLSDVQATALIREGQRRPEEVATTLEHALVLRELIYRIFLAVAHEEQAASEDLALLSAAYPATLAHAHLVPMTTGYDWDWSDDIAMLDRMLWPVVRSAIELITSLEVNRIKECASDNCGWLFLDTSKNGSRRWCSMEGCGSRDKMRRQYAKKRRQGDRETR